MLPCAEVAGQVERLILLRPVLGGRRLDASDLGAVHQQGKLGVALVEVFRHLQGDGVRS